MTSGATIRDRDRMRELFFGIGVAPIIWPKLPESFSIFTANCANMCGNTRVDAARIFADVGQKMAAGFSKMFDALGSKLNTFMSVKILFLS